MANLRQLSGYGALLRQVAFSTHPPLIWVWKVAQSKALLSRSALSPQPPQWQEGLQWRHNYLDISLPPAAKFPIKSIRQINPVLSWTKLHFSEKKISSCRGEWNPLVVLSSHRLRKDIIQKFPWSIQTQTSSGPAQAIQNTFKNNYKRLPARFIYAPSTPIL